MTGKHFELFHHVNKCNFLAILTKHARLQYFPSSKKKKSFADFILSVADAVHLLQFHLLILFYLLGPNNLTKDIPLTAVKINCHHRPSL